MTKYLQAYPNTDGVNFLPKQRDTNKWLNTIKSIYNMYNNGIDKNSALKELTSGWEEPEINDFLNWVKFYEEGSHLKYKFANIWLNQSPPGYFLQVKKPEQNDQNNVEESIDKKTIIEKQRAKIIGRLDSAEKLLRARDGQILAGKEFETLMEAIYQLKKKIQLVNKITVANKTYEDLIIREANILNKKGFEEASHVLYKIAQELPPPAEPALPTVGNGGAPGGVPSMGPGMPQTSLENSPNNSNFSKGINDFLKRMNSANLTEDKDILEINNTEDGKIEDSNNVKDSDLKDSEDELFVSEDDFVSTAQAIEESLEQPLEPKNLEVPNTNLDSKPNLENKLAPKEQQSKEISFTSDFDNKLDQLMKNVTVTDIITELEALSKIFKTREIPRRLARADMMLDSLGLAPFFPSLSEAQNKSLEANNYIATRIDDILSKLSGSITANKIDLEGESSVKPEVENLKNKLEFDAQKEKKRKELRKEQEAAEVEMNAKPIPEIEVTEDMNEPVQTQPTQPIAPPVK